MKCPNCHSKMDRLDILAFQVVNVVTGESAIAYQCRFCSKVYLLRTELIEITNPFPLIEGNFCSSPFREVTKKDLSMF